MKDLMDTDDIISDADFLPAAQSTSNLAGKGAPDLLSSMSGTQELCPVAKTWPLIKRSQAVHLLTKHWHKPACTDVADLGVAFSWYRGSDMTARRQLNAPVHTQMGPDPK